MLPHLTRLESAAACCSVEQWGQNFLSDSCSDCKIRFREDEICFVKGRLNMLNVSSFTEEQWQTSHDVVVCKVQVIKSSQDEVYDFSNILLDVKSEIGVTRRHFVLQSSEEIGWIYWR